MGAESGALLLEWQRWDHDPGFGLEGLRGAATLLDGAKRGFDPFGELFATRPKHPFNHLFNAAVRPDAKTDGVLRHHESNRGH
jgi:hypothetical protein